MKKEFLQTMAEGLNLPPESMSQVALTHLRGRRSVTVEKHCGITSYSNEIVCIAVKHGAILVVGQGLHIAHMSKECIEIRGKICRIELE